MACRRLPLVASDQEVKNYARYRRSREGQISGRLQLLHRGMSAQMMQMSILQLDRLGYFSSAADYTFVIVALGREGLWDVAMELLKLMRRREVELDAIALNAAITAYSAGDRWQRAIGVLHSAGSLGVECNVVSYNAAIEACVSIRWWQKALRFLHDLQTLQLPATSTTYTSAVRACDNRERWRCAETCLRSLRRKGMLPDMVAHSVAIGVFARVQQWEAAMSVVDANLKEQVGVAFPRAFLAAALGAFARGTIWRNALQLFQRMQAGVTIFGDEQVHYYSHIRVERPARAEDNDFEHDMWNELIGMCVKSQQWLQTLRLFQRMKQSGMAPDRVVCNAALSAMRRRQGYGGMHAYADDVAPALRLLKGMHSIGLLPNGYSHDVVLRICARSRDPAAAADVLRLMADARLTPRSTACSALLRACQGEGKDQRCALWTEALLLLSCFGFFPISFDVNLYDVAVDAVSGASQWERALLVGMGGNGKDTSSGPSSSRHPFVPALRPAAPKTVPDDVQDNRWEALENILDDVV